MGSKVSPNISPFHRTQLLGIDEKQRDFYKRLDEQGFSPNEIHICIQLLELSDEYITNPRSSEFKIAVQRVINSHSDVTQKGD